MSYAVTPDELIRQYGLSGVVYFPRYEHQPRLDEKTARFLSSVGLPHSDQFMTRTEGESIKLSDKFSDPEKDGDLPAECSSWIEIGWFQYMTLALDPVDGKVYAFPEGTPLDEHEQLHRDVESLVYTLLAFEKFTTACSSGADLDTLETRFKDRINSFDPVPFRDEESQWSRIIEGVLEESWTA
ncbi:SUKH-4 family immunity protein [Streptomyces sp. NPDC002992]|uniref:SUKH-4 family immunity protein n=1 Tax=Streptomyces sp. NPDC002992 TaxID=3154273 RepID=UPI0033B3F7F9